MSKAQLLDRDETVLCVVDIQEKLAAMMDERNRVVESARKLVLAARRLDVPIVVTEQYPKGLGPTVAKLAAALGDRYLPIEKLAFSCAREQAYADRLKSLKRDHVLLCGMETHVCVLQTCMDLLDRGHDVHIAADAVCSRRADHKGLALDQMRAGGAVVTCAEAAIFQWLGQAGTPEFKDLLTVLK